MRNATDGSEGQGVRARALRLQGRVGEVAPGVAVSLLVAVCAQFLSDHYGAPAMLLALLLGVALGFLGEEGRCKAGIAFSTRQVLRFGVALLGLRVSVALFLALGFELVGLVVLAVLGTAAFGVLCARMMNREWSFGMLTGGSVAICGASAAMALAAVLPKGEHAERNLIFTVLGVTVLSTVAMIVYPLLISAFALDDRTIGFFLGATIHDVAQVVGAGYSVSNEAGDNATLVKLIRVTMLAPLVMALSLFIRFSGAGVSGNEGRPPLMPFFVLAFLILATLNSLFALPVWLTEPLGTVSRWSLLSAIAAVGMKTSLKRMLEVGKRAVILIVLETVFIAALVLAGLRFLASVGG